MYATGKFTIRSVAEHFGVSVDSMGNLLRGKSYKTRRSDESIPTPIKSKTKIKDLQGTPEQIEIFTFFVKSVNRGDLILTEDGRCFSKSGNWLGSRTPTGYTTIRATYQGRTYRILLHRFMHLIFIGAIPKGWVVDHKDGNKSNNHYLNLEAITHGENTRRARGLGLVDSSKDSFARVGEKNTSSKLTEREVIEIKIMLAQGYSNTEIAKKFKVGRFTINAIANGETWSHVGTKPSNLCSSCTHVNDHVTIYDQTWTCSDCGETHDYAENNKKNTERYPIKRIVFDRSIPEYNITLAKWLKKAKGYSNPKISKIIKCSQATPR